MQMWSKLAVGLLSLTMASSVLAAGNAENGKRIRHNRCVFGCAMASDFKGMGTFPPLAGKDAGYIQTQLKAFKSGERKTPMARVMEPQCPTSSPTRIWLIWRPI